MLNDATIRRDKNYFVLRRLILKIRKMTAVKYRKKLNELLQKQLIGIDFTIFSNNCLGGVFYHDLGRRFTSPLINTAMDGPDFIRFLKRPKYYLERELEFVKWEEKGHDYPIAHIDDIEVRFVHYHSEEEAKTKWIERTKRIIWDNIFVIATNQDGLNTSELLKEFDELPYNKIMYVSNEYPQYKWATCVPQFKGRFQVRIMTNFANMRGERYYETCFDLAKWIKNNSKI